MSEQTEFLKDLDNSTAEDIFEKPIEQTEENLPTEEKETEEQLEMKLKNRRERRLAEKLQSEREANIALNARLQGISEAQKLRNETEESEYLRMLDRIYGNATPEAIEATELLKKAFQGVHESAKKSALEELQKERQKEAELVAKEESELEDIISSVEDQFNVDLSADKATRKGFLTLMEKVSPKDKNGNIIEFADAKTVWELYESRKEKSTRAKDLSGRSMVRSGSNPVSTLQDDSTVRFLKENGII
jgi:hypothetical protein